MTADPLPIANSLGLGTRLTGDRNYPVFKLATQADPASVILKLVGEVCNLDCSYCYEKRKPYDGRRILRAAEVEAFLLSLPNPYLAIEFHGGEPLLYPKDEFVALSAVLGRLGQRLMRLTVQTNATLLDRQMVRFLMTQFPKLQIGISVDGPPDINALRVDLKGRSSSVAVAAGLAACAAENVDVGVICVVTKGSIGQVGRILRYFAEQPAVKVVKLVPCFDTNVRQEQGPSRRPEIRFLLEQSRNASLPWAITPAEYTSFLEEALNLWTAEIGPEHFVLEPLLSALRANRALPQSNCHFGAHKCSHVYTLYPDGSIGSCDELQRGAATYGKLGETSAFEAARLHWGERMPHDVQELLAMCTSCEAAPACGGGCLATRRRMQEVGQAEVYCEHRRALLGATRLLTTKEGA